MNTANKHKALWFLGLCGMVLAISLLTGSAHYRHPLVGSWQASDGTVLIFRSDNSFVGRDYQGSRIFGTWTALNDKQIGFQSHFRGGSYRPEYAEVTPSGMRYVCGDTDDFMECVVIDREKATKLVDSASLKFK